jgi:glycosyltransferase involved in cell wall biosynthesis
MKIGVIVDNELNNDIRVLREIKILRDHGHEIFILCLAYKKESYKTTDGVIVKRIRLRRWIKDTLFFSMNLLPLYELIWSNAIRKFINRNSIEALHVNDLYMAKAGHEGILKSSKKILMVLDLHENYPYTITTYNWTKGFLRHLISQPEKWQKKEGKYLCYADKIIVLSSDFRDLLIRRYPDLSESNFAVLPNVPDLTQVNIDTKQAVKNPFDNDFPVLLYYGVIAERRGLFDALSVFIKMSEEGFYMNFLLIGPVDKKDRKLFFKLISNKYVAYRIHYIPWINFSRFWSWLDICDICIAPFHKNPQHESGIANKVFDYMLGKKPVLVSDCAPQKKLIEHYNCGMVFTDQDELKGALKELCNNPQMRITMGENGYRAILNEYNTGVFKDNLLNIFNPEDKNIVYDANNAKAGI